MIYLDANASSTPRPAALAVLDEHVNCRSQVPLNPSSVHAAGREARRRLERASSEIGNFFGFQKSDANIIFASGGSEACNSLVKGFVDVSIPGHALVSSIEHPAVMEPALSLQNFGWEVELLPVGSDGRVGVETASSRLKSETALLSIMLANNESGTVQPLEEIAINLRKAGYKGLIVSDITQAVGKFEFSLPRLFQAGVDAVAFSGHKVGALHGVGAVVFSTSDPDVCRQFRPLVLGGPQQERLRAGTENLLAIESLTEVLRGMKPVLSDELQRISGLRELFWAEISVQVLELLRLTPVEGEILSNTLQLCLPGIDAADLVVAADLAGLCLSTGAACSSGKQEPSQVARAAGLSLEEARGVFRVSLDWTSTAEEVREAVLILSGVCRRMLEVEENFKTRVAV